MQTLGTLLGQQLHRDGAKPQLAAQEPVSSTEAALSQPGHTPHMGDTAFWSPTASPRHTSHQHEPRKNLKGFFLYHDLCRRGHLSSKSHLQATLVLTPKTTLGWTWQTFYAPRDGGNTAETHTSLLPGPLLLFFSCFPLKPKTQLSNITVHSTTLYTATSIAKTHSRLLFCYFLSSYMKIKQQEP